MQTTVVDFTVTQKGLEEQLLGGVIQKEQKSLEEQLKNVLEEVSAQLLFREITMYFFIMGANRYRRHDSKRQRKKCTKHITQ